MARPRPPSRARRTVRGLPPAELLARALLSLNEGVIIGADRVSSGGFKIEFANEAFCRMTGYEPAELIAQPHGLVHSAADVALLRRWRGRPDREQPLVGETVLQHKSGASVYAAWTFSALTDARGRVTHLVGTYRDVTEKRRLQEALVHAQRLDAVGRLAGGVAHDFNNLLSVINGYCEILSGTVGENAKARKEIAEIHQAGQRATALVRQLLAFSRRQAMDSRVINLNQLVRENADILTRLLAPDKTLALDLDEQLGNVKADPSQLQQVLLNLTLNARDALAKSGRVTITTHNRQVRPGLNRRLTDLSPGHYVVLAVNDNGCGMDPATQAQVFEPFFTTKGEGKGTGLGLALVYGVVKQSGGHILVQSTVGQGSTFEIYLPQVDEPASTSPGTLAPLPVTRGRESVLLVERDAIIGKMVAGILTADGYEVVTASSAEAATRQAREHKRPMQVLIIDPHDPEGGALTATRALAKRWPGLRVLWASPSPVEPLPDLPSGQQAVLNKPFALSALLRAVRALLDASAGSAARAGTGPF